jgi:glycine oxidase
MKNVDFLIIGQGIAGTVLAETLIQREKKVHVIDDGHLNSSSMVAAGMWNPVVFKRLSKSWEIDQCIEEAFPFYKALEKKLGVPFFHIKRLVRIFPDQHAANEFDEKSDSPEYKTYLNPNDRANIVLTEQPFGHGIVEKAGWCNLPVVLNNYREYLNTIDSFSFDRFNENELLHGESGWIYKDIHAEHVVICTGSKMKESKFFGDLPLVPNKGQVLTIQLHHYTMPELINFGNFLLPIGSGFYRLGATYDLEDPNPEPTIEGKEALLDSLREVVPAVAQVAEHKAGYRPTTRDRRPLIGSHPTLKGIHVFNGLGSKGVIQAPYCAQAFADFIIDGKTLSKEMNITRLK